MGSQEERTGGKAAAGRPSEVVDCGRGQAVRQLADPMAPHSHIDKPGGTVGERSRLCNPGLQLGEIKPLIENPFGGSGGSRRNSQPHRRVHWRDPQGPRACTSPPTCKSEPEGPSVIVGSRGSV